MLSDVTLKNKQNQKASKTFLIIPLYIKTVHFNYNNSAIVYSPHPLCCHFYSIIMHFCSYKCHMNSLKKQILF